MSVFYLYLLDSIKLCFFKSILRFSKSDICKCPFLKKLADFCFFTFLENHKFQFVSIMVTIPKKIIIHYDVDDFGRTCS